MRLLLERIPKEDEEIDFTVDDLGPDLLITTEWSALEFGDGKIQFALQQHTRGTGGEKFVVGQEIPVEQCPFDQVSLLVIVGHQRDFFMPSDRDDFIGHGEVETDSRRQRDEIKRPVVAGLSAELRRGRAPLR